MYLKVNDGSWIAGDSKVAKLTQNTIANKLQYGEWDTMKIKWAEAISLIFSAKNEFADRPIDTTPFDLPVSCYKLYLNITYHRSFFFARSQARSCHVRASNRFDFFNATEFWFE